MSNLKSRSLHSGLRTYLTKYAQYLGSFKNNLQVMCLQFRKSEGHSSQFLELANHCYAAVQCHALM